MEQADPPHLMLGRIIRAQRELAALPMRELAASVGISNPYLSQIERGLRAPSETVLNAIAESLETSVQTLYAEAGYIEPTPVEELDRPSRLVAEIEAAAELTAPQRKALLEIYRALVDANAVRRARRQRAED